MTEKSQYPTEYPANPTKNTLLFNEFHDFTCYSISVTIDDTAVIEGVCGFAGIIGGSYVLEEGVVERRGALLLAVRRRGRGFVVGCCCIVECGRAD